MPIGQKMAQSTIEEKSNTKLWKCPGGHLILFSRFYVFNVKKGEAEVTKMDPRPQKKNPNREIPNER